MDINGSFVFIRRMGRFLLMIWKNSSSFQPEHKNIEYKIAWTKYEKKTNREIIASQNYPSGFKGGRDKH